MQANFVHFLMLFLRLPAADPGQRDRYRGIKKVVNRIRLAVALMFFSLSVGTLGYVIIDHYPWFDAYYMSVITLASVGFGEIHPLSTAGRLFTSFLILFNVGLFAYAISTITNILTEGGLTKLMNDFRMNRNIERLEGHVIICGFGRHALEVTQELSKQGTQFVVVENSREKIDALRASYDYLHIEGDATIDHVLHEAGILRAHAIVITLPHDADNLFITLSARQLNPKLRIITRANSKADEEKIKRAGADHTVVPERIGGFYMATLVKKPDLVEFFSLLSSMGPGNMVFEEIEVERLNPAFQHKSIGASGITALSRATIIAVRFPDGHYELNPLPDLMLQPGLHIVVLGNREQMDSFTQKVLLVA
jgi:voltage-gated potassium channel